MRESDEGGYSTVLRPDCTAPHDPITVHGSHLLRCRDSTYGSIVQHHTIQSSVVQYITIQCFTVGDRDLYRVQRWWGSEVLKLGFAS